MPLGISRQLLQDISSCGQIRPMRYYEGIVGYMFRRQWLGAEHGRFYEEFHSGKFLGKIKTVFRDQVHFFFLQLTEEEPNKLVESTSAQRRLWKLGDSLLMPGWNLRTWLHCFAPIRITHLGYRWNWIFTLLRFHWYYFLRTMSPLSINMVLKYRYDKNHYTWMFQCISFDSLTEHDISTEWFLS